MTTKLRASNIAIEVPEPNSDAWVHVTINKVFIDDNGNIINDIPKFDYVSKPLSSIGMNAYPFIDPVTGESIEVSGYGIAQCITSYVERVLADKYGEGSML